MAEVVANGVKLHVQRLGRHSDAVRSGTPTVMFVHGLFIDNLSSLYYSLANPVAHAGADTILYDLRGHGRSERPPGGYRLDDAVGDLMGLMDALDLAEPVHIVGHSYGASVALRAGLSHPGRVGSLTLIEPHCSGTADGGSWADDIADTLTATALCFERYATADAVRRSTQRKIRALRAANAFLNETSLIDDVASAPPFTDEELGGLGVPTMAVYGEHTDLASSVEMIRRCLPGCRLEVFPGIGHSVLRDASEQMARLLIDWLPVGSVPERAAS